MHINKGKAYGSHGEGQNKLIFIPILPLMCGNDHSPQRKIFLFVTWVCLSLLVTNSTCNRTSFTGGMRL